MMKFKIYLVENDLLYGQFLRQYLLQNIDFEIELFVKAEDCLSVLYNNPDLICINNALSDINTDLLLTKILSYNKNFSVLIFDPYNDTNTTIKILNTGEIDSTLKNEYAVELLESSICLIRKNKLLKNKIDIFSDNDKKKLGELKAIVKLATVMYDENNVDILDLNYLHKMFDNIFYSPEKTLRVYTVDIIAYYLNKYNQNVVKVADKLEIGKSTIYNMIKSGEISLKK